MQPLYLGVARECITPAVGGQLYGYAPDVFSSSVEDDLTVTAFYFRQGATEALMLSATVCLVQTQLAESILQSVWQRFGIAREGCMLCATHTHSGPNTMGESGWGDIDREYCEHIFRPAVLSAVGRAMECAQPVRMGAASGNSLVGVNRRERTENGRVRLGQDADGIFDPKMTVLSFVDAEDRPLANIIHYGAHGTAAGRNCEITRDWSGRMVDALEAHSGGLTAFFNGPEGDVGPRLTNGKTVGDITYVRQLGEVAAADAVEIYRCIHGYETPRLTVSRKCLSIPLKKRLPLAQAEQKLEQYRDNTINLAGMIRRRMEDTVRSYEEGFTDAEARGTEQTLIALGDRVFVSFPYELFSRIGLEIGRQTDGAEVLSLSNTNGSEGYFVTEDEICRGGYEVDMFLYGHMQSYCAHADECLVKETVIHIQSAMKESEE